MLMVNDNNGKKQIVAVTKKNELGESHLQLLNSDFSVIFSLKISNPVHLIQLENVSDETLILSKICNGDGLISELRVQCVYETEPELRLTRLLRKQRFDEAEKFAEKHHLGSMLILKARAQVIIDKTVCTSDDVNRLIEILESIDDDHFKLQCCSNVECNSYEDLRKILNYGSMIVPKTHHENKEQISIMLRVVMDTLFKFDTYMAVYSHYDLQTWSRFLTCDLIDELKMYLKNFQIEEATIIYSRLDFQTVDKLTEEKIEEILLILNNVPINICQPFLLTFIPITMVNNPSTLPIFVKWLRNRILQLEKRDSFNFPENGLKFAEYILKLLKVEEGSYIFFQRQCMLHKEVLNGLVALTEALRGLQLLKNNFRINISLSEYMMGPKAVIRNLLNIVMPPEDYDLFLKEFLYKFMIQNGFEPDEIFLEEIKNLIKYDEEYWVNIVEAILKYISSVKIKLEAVIEILENAQVPWCDTVRAIGQCALQYSHPLVSNIKDILENEPRLVVLRNPKYKIKEKQITTIYELEYVVRRIIYINEPSIVDDVYQLCKTEAEKRGVDIILVQHFIKNKNEEQAMSVLDNIGNKQEIYLCAKWVSSFAEIIINNEINSNKYAPIYYKALGPLFRRLMENNVNKTDSHIIDEDLKILRGVFKLNKLFGRNVTTYDLRSFSKKNSIFDEIIEEVSEDFNKGSLNMEYIFNVCDNLAVFLSLDKDSVLIKFCEKVAKYDAIVKVAERLYDGESDSRSLCLVAVLLLKYTASCDTHMSCDSFSDNSDGCLLPCDSGPGISSSSENASNSFVVGSRLCEKIVVKALINAKEYELHDVMEVVNWIYSCFYLTRSQDPLQTELFKHIYHSEHILPASSTFAAIRNVFELFCNFIGSDRNPCTTYRYLTNFVTDATLLSEEQLLQEISMLPATIDSLCREGQHLTAYKLLVTLENGLKRARNINPSILKLLSSIINKKCIPQLLHVVVSSKYIDLVLFENLLLASQKDYYRYIEHYLKLYKRQSRKLHDIATVGIKLLDFYNVSAGKDVLLKAIITCKWWNKLKSVITGIPYDVFFKENSDTRLKLLFTLDLLDIVTIREYCDDYKLDVQVYYMEYLKSILVNWKPDYEYKASTNGRGTLLIKNDENILLSKCTQVIDIIKDKDAVYSLLDKIWDIANFYHYEVFICILKIIGNTGKREKTKNLDLPLLLFLKNYHRFSPPGQNEKEQWYSKFTESQTLDALSEFRLPFIQTLFTLDIWNIIRPEINLKSYRYWFDAANILRKNLKKDDICIYAVKEVVTSGILGKEESGSWTLYPKFEDLFAEVDACVQNISNLERATSVVYHLMYHTPNGADKVNAAELSYKYAKKYKEKNPNCSDIEAACIKVKTKYYSSSAMHILHTFQLAEDKYLQLVAQPDDLVHALYRDERIVEQAECINFSCPDINKAVDALGVLYDLKIQQIRYNLLNHWLCSSSNEVDFDSTLAITSIAKLDTNTDDNLKRATYICLSGDKSFWQTYLLKAGVNEDDVADSEQRNLSFKAKALKCFCAISDVDTIIRMTDGDYNEFLNYIDKLSLLSELECLGIALNISTLDKYNKKELLKRLSQVGKPIAVKAMASVCTTYCIKDIRYWEFIIGSAIKLGMYTELRTYVDFLKIHCYKSFYINAWQVIINNAFHIPNTLSKEELHEVYIKNFLMIQSCPVLYSLNFENVVQRCIIDKKFEFAAILLQYLSDEKKDVYVKKISPNRTLFLDLDNLSKNGIWGTRNIKSWLATKNLF
ncbi:kinetochore-associated protein 1-like [Anoplophora glabripennis]|uniref:kinetochore-associated protein 1-like n=1 Tax=Anoplophora glabripennis TaxID=217634 RepID=UPI000C75BE89|nr:kinetochore-associated protein 1-like [Anoplophora glabripennis]